MCVFLLSVRIIINLCIFSLFLHYLLVYMFTFYCRAMFATFFTVYFVYDSYNNNNTQMYVFAWCAGVQDRINLYWNSA